MRGLLRFRAFSSPFSREVDPDWISLRPCCHLVAEGGVASRFRFGAGLCGSQRQNANAFVNLSFGESTVLLFARGLTFGLWPLAAKVSAFVAEPQGIQRFDALINH